MTLNFSRITSIVLILICVGVSTAWAGSLSGNTLCPLVPPPLLRPASLTLDATVNFATDQAALGAADQNVLDNFARDVRKTPGRQLVNVDGHTDSVGSRSYNERLSQRRAMSVESYLVAQGISDAAILATGYGETQPIASNATAAGRAQNRRTEVRAHVRSPEYRPGVAIYPAVIRSNRIARYPLILAPGRSARATTLPSSQPFQQGSVSSNFSTQNNQR